MTTRAKRKLRPPSGSGSIPPTAAGPWTEILTTTGLGYTPLGVEDKYLRVTATYTDRHDSDKSAEMAVSAHVVRAAPPNNAAPVFSDEDTVTQRAQYR